MVVNRWSLILLCLLVTHVGSSQQKSWSAAEIQLALNKLNVLGTVLYVAAHPDDENTRLIAYFANEELARTGYLSITRGDGGQNLIGTEKGELMGLLRTQELLAARRIDGGEQLFTRAVDFGYSKSQDETLEKWGREEVLADVVWAIRKFRPDVIINRFPAEHTRGHGHHSASAMLAMQAFDKAADPKAFPEQLKYVKPWQPKRILLNASTWWDRDLVENAKGSDEYITVDVGAYNKLLGKSYSEIAAASRSLHKSQGFGASSQRGSRIEYLKHLKGEKATETVFDGVDITWRRVHDGQPIGDAIASAIAGFDPQSPQLIVPQLVKAHLEMKKWFGHTHAHQIGEEQLVKRKQQELETLILACSGIWLEATASKPLVAFGDQFEVTISAVQRGSKVIWLSTGFENGDTTLNLEMKDNQLYQFKRKMSTSGRGSHPYWLEQDFEGMYQVNQQQWIGVPENEVCQSVEFILSLAGQGITITRPVVFKRTDRVKGEIYRPFVQLPAITVNIEEPVYVFASGKSKEINVTVLAHRNGVQGIVRLQVPESWSYEPQQIVIELEKSEEEETVEFKVTPPQIAAEGVVKAIMEVDGSGFNKSLVQIDYDHVPLQTLTPECKAKAIRLEVQIKGQHVGYLPGAGDNVAEAIRQLGYQVTELTTDELTNDLSGYGAIVTGIRAYNTEKEMVTANSHLLEYVKNGGTLIVQYNTTWGLPEMNIGPYPFKIGHDRVTVEEAPVTFLEEKHALLNVPNKLTKADFDGWVQERGLYFASEWDEQYTPILGWNDPGEDMKKGSLLVAKYGEGHFIYTGISFFRQLPAGVPGAYRLFANILSYGQ